MDPGRIARAIRALRIRRGWRQLDVATRAGLSRALVSNLERGRLSGVTIGTLIRVVEALGAELEIRIRWRGEGLERLIDEAHAAIVEQVVGMFQAGGWEVAVEVSFSIWGERGRIDVLAFHHGVRALAVGEVKSAVPDSQDAIGDLDRKTRLAPKIAAERGWRVATTSRLLFVGAARTARRRIKAVDATFATAFPVRGPAVTRWIRDPSSGPIAGLLFVSFATGNSRRRPVGGRQRVRTPKARQYATGSGDLTGGPVVGVANATPSGD